MIPLAAFLARTEGRGWEVRVRSPLKLSPAGWVAVAAFGTLVAMVADTVVTFAVEAWR